MTWASAATATRPCGGSNTAGTLSAALYTQTFGYDTMGRLTSGPLGMYTYGDPAHVHAASAIGGTAWTASYDAAGNMTCRAPSSTTTCAGTPTGAQLGYNNEGQLQSWQNAPSSPSTTAQFLYDGQGQRVEQSVNQSGTTTTTVYVGNVEEVATTGGTTTTTAYYYMAGKRIGLSVGGVISYLASDALGSDAVTLNGSGTATAAQLFAPYGALRYSSGTMPTSYGFTGQRSDTMSGLDYYGARYYDPLAGQFTSGDSTVPGGGLDLWGLSRYAYVEGNPENRTDPTGHINLSVGDDYSAVPIDNAFQGSYAWGSSPTVTYHRGFSHAYPTSRSRRQVWTKQPSGLKVSHGPCPVASACLNAEGGANGNKQKPASAFGNCTFDGCGMAFNQSGGGSGSERLKIGAGVMGTGGMGGCEANPDECQKLVDAMARLAQRVAGFSDEGEPLVVDNSLPVNPQTVAQALRDEGYNAQSVGEIFGRDPGDAAIRSLVDVINGRVVATDVGHDVGGGFGDRAIAVAGQIRQVATILRLVAGA